MNPLPDLSASTTHDEVTTRVIELCDGHDKPEAVAENVTTFLRTLDMSMNSIQNGAPALRRSEAQRLATAADAMGARELGRWCRVLMVSDDAQYALSRNAQAEADTVAGVLEMHLPQLAAGKAPAQIARQTLAA